MGKSKGQVHCSIFNWLKEYDHQLAEALEQNCLHNLLNPGKGRGITFLYPAEKKQRDAIIKSLGGEMEEVVHAVRVVKSLILRDYFTPEKFAEFGKDIPSDLKIRIEVAAVSGNEVTFAHKGKAKVMDGFNPRPWRDDGQITLAVYEYKGEPMPMKGEPTKYNNMAKTPIKGGWSPATNSQDAFAMAKTVEGRALAALQRKMYNKPTNPYLEAMVSLAEFAKKGDSWPAEFLVELTPYPESSFYAIVAPYQNNGPLKTLVSEWITAKDGLPVTKCNDLGAQWTALWEAASALTAPEDTKLDGPAAQRNEIRYVIDQTMPDIYNTQSVADMTELLLDLQLLYSKEDYSILKNTGNTQLAGAAKNSYNVVYGNYHPSLVTEDVPSFKDVKNSTADWFARMSKVLA